MPAAPELDAVPQDPVDLERTLVADDVLLSRIRAGDAQAFTDFHDRYAGVTFRVAMRTLNNPTLAREATQEGFLAIWNQRTRYASQKGPAKGWLLTIVHNRAVDVLRRENRRQNHEASGDHLAGFFARDNVEAEIVARDQAREVRDLLAAMPPKLRSVIELAYVQGLTQVEIASRLDLPLGTVKGRTRLALRELRAAYPFAP